MDFIYFCEKIGLPDRAIIGMNDMKMSQIEYKELKSLLNSDKLMFFNKVMEKQNFKQWFLYLYCHFACDAHTEYINRGISEDIYFDTFSDITIWFHICRRDYKEDGIMEYKWLCNHVQLKLFRLGRLQFELVEVQENVKEKQEILYVHIPEGEPLKESACSKSFEMAGQFFPQISTYMCHSWLLFPGLKEILSEESNIIKFQNRFQITQVDFNTREAEERIYLKVEEDPKKYPEKTILQKMAKIYLLNGKKLGNGTGVILHCHS